MSNLIKTQLTFTDVETKKRFSLYQDEETKDFELIFDEPTDGIFKRITDVEKHMNANMTSLKEDYSERLHETRADITNLVTWKETATETIKSLKENESLIVKENTQLKHEVSKLITWKEKAEKVFMLMFLPTLGFMIKLIWAGVIDLLSKAVK
jgi:hypothetical protein